MRAVIMHAPGDVRVEDREDPRIIEPTDAVIRLAATCICGSDLHALHHAPKLVAASRKAVSTSASASSPNS